ISCRTDYGPTFGPDFSHGRIAITISSEDCYVQGTVSVNDAGGNTITATYYALLADVGGLHTGLTITGGTGTYAGVTGDGQITSGGSGNCDSVPWFLTGELELHATLP